MAEYISSYTGEEIDEAVEAAKTSAKQADLASLAVRVTTLENQSSKPSIDETVYAAIRTNVNTLRLKINAIIDAVDGMASYAFINAKPNIAEIGEMTWPSSESLSPALTSPSSIIYLGIMAANEQTITKQQFIKGNNLTKALQLSIADDGFSVSPGIVTPEQANAGIYVNISYQRNSSSSSYLATGTLNITSYGDGVGGDFPVSANVRAEGDTTPVLASPSGRIDFGTLAASAQTITKSVYIKGSNLTNPLTLAITAGGGTSGGFTLATTTVSAADANAGTNVNISYTRDSSDTAYSDSGTLTITSQDNVGGTFDLSIYVDAEGSITPDPGEDTDYIQDKLLLHLDGKSQGGQSGKWVDRIRSKAFTLFGSPSVGANGITFNSEGQYALCLDKDLFGSLGYSDCTIEICFTADNSFGADGYYNPFFVTNVEDKIACIYGYSSNSYKHFDFRTRRTPATSDVSWKVDGFTPTAGSLYRVSMNKTALVVNGEQIGENNTSGIAPVPSNPDANYPMMVGGRVGASTTRVAHATIHEVRIYNSILTVAQMQANQAEDLTRYGTGNS